MDTPPFAVLLDLIDERSAALREAAAKAGPAAAVPGCPDWTVSDLIAHLGEVQRFWAAVVAAGPGQPPPDDGQVPGRVPSGDAAAWSAASTATLLGALRASGPGRACWTWWAQSPAAQDSWSVARHQVQEAAVHAWDAQQAAGRPDPLPSAVAVDGVGEFLTVGLGAMGAWPHEPGQITFTAGDGAGWLLDLGPGGARVSHTGEHTTGATAGAAATVGAGASDLVLFLYGRQPAQPVRISGDRSLVERLAAWAPTS
jgi:uncharacterized protein (TIGR03083 family)